MANDEEQSNAIKKRCATKPKNQKKITAKPKKKAVRASGNARQRAVQKLSAADKFRKSASKEVASGANEIAKGLRNKAAQGNISAAKFLWDLANSAKAESKPSDSGLGAALSKWATRFENDAEVCNPADGDSPTTQND